MKMRALFTTMVAAGAALIVAACGGGEPTATSVPPPTATLVPPPTAASQPTATPRPTAVPLPTATTGPTAAPQPTATPTPARAAVPTPISLSGKRGGTLNIRAIFQPALWDTFEARSSSDFHVSASIMNNLIWVDPYGDGKTLVGDLAESWEFSGDGKTLTFFLRKGIKWHDGTPMTAKDVVYNFERGWKPRSPTMTFFKLQFAALQAIEAPDDFTVRLSLAKPSNSLLRVIAMNQFLVYPAHIPLPDKGQQWTANPIGTGPFKFKSVTPSVKIEVTRNDAYWKPGLPYLDGIAYTIMQADVAVAALRTGRFDCASLDPAVVDGLSDAVRKEIGFTSYPLTVSYPIVTMNQKPPFTDKRVRQAVSLTIDRHAAVNVWLEGRGNPNVAALIPPEVGGQWGISTEVMKTRPGYAEDKTADLARAKQLVAQSGIDPTRFTLQVLGNSTAWPIFSQIVERNLVSLGFKVNLVLVDSTVYSGRALNGEYDVNTNTTSISFDDPADYLTPLVVTGGVKNYEKWSNSKLDALMVEQDATLDVAKRKQMLTEAQEIIIDDAVMLPIAVRRSASGHFPWVKNYPTRLPVLFSSFFRWEQLYLER